MVRTEPNAARHNYPPWASNMTDKNDRKKEDIKEEIIIKTRAVVSKMGYKKSSTEEIARSLNKTKGALYHYFKNREEIIQAVITYEGEQVKKAILEGIGREKNPQKRLETFFIIRLKKTYELWDYYQSVIEEYFNRYQYIMLALKDYNKYELQVVKSILKEGITSGVFEVTDIPLTARTICKAMRAYDFYLFQGEPLKDTRIEMTEVLRIIIRGISRK